MLIAIDTITPTTKPSNIWLDKNLKKTSFERLKFLPISLYVSFLNITFHKILEKIKILLISDKIYNYKKSLIYCPKFSTLRYLVKSMSPSPSII